MFPCQFIIYSMFNLFPILVVKPGSAQNGFKFFYFLITLLHLFPQLTYNMRQYLAFQLSVLL